MGLVLELHACSQLSSERISSGLHLNRSSFFQYKSLLVKLIDTEQIKRSCQRVYEQKKNRHFIISMIYPLSLR